MSVTMWGAIRQNQISRVLAGHCPLRRALFRTYERTRLCNPYWSASGHSRLCIPMMTFTFDEIVGLIL